MHTSASIASIHRKVWGSEPECRRTAETRVHPSFDSIGYASLSVSTALADWNEIAFIALYHSAVHKQKRL